MNSWIRFSVLVAMMGIVDAAAAITVVPRDAAQSSGQAADDLVLVGRGNACDKIAPTVREIVGASRAKCYLKLFELETSCRPFLKQAKGNAGNAHAGYGLCSLEASAAVRRQNRRGKDCNDISTVANQVKCCRAIMRKTPRYFGPYIRGKIKQCG